MNASFPPSLKELLERRDIWKIGRGIGARCKKAQS